MMAITVIVTRIGDANICNAILKVSQGSRPCQVVEQWQRRSTHFQRWGRVPPVAWKIAKPGDIGGLLAQAARHSRQFCKEK